jgi:3-oxoacyl-[acyl-carrier protein] reductase
MSLSGKIAYVTGGSRGIGKACALAFAAAGADVAICHLDDEVEGKAVVAAIEGLGRRAFQMPVDMSGLADIKAFAATAEAALGPCDILLNNAGMNIRSPFEEVTEADFDKLFDVHVKGMFFMAQAVYPGMVRRGEGRIINISSQLAIKGSAGAVTYCAAKGGVLSFTRALAFEAGPHGVLVNAIAPGPIETDLTRRRGPEWKARISASLPLGRFGFPEEIAATALMLAGPGGTYYCGACLSPNGGDIMH